MVLQHRAVSSSRATTPRGCKYGTIGTPEKYFLTWKEDEADNSRFKLDKYLLKMCSKER
jgi:type I restriction enzyme R subunit